MNALVLFVLKSTIVSGILYAWYMLALRNKRMHNYNRFYLLATLYLSIQIPLLHFTWSPVLDTPPAVFTSARMLLHTLNGTVSVPFHSQSGQALDFDWETLVTALAGLISLCLLATMLIRIVWVLRLVKRYPALVINGITLVQTDLPKAPFSFMNRIFWRDTIAPETESGRLILRHELAHIRQRHTCDKLVSQLLSCIFWMNPFYWIIQKELAMVHEFIADEQAIVNNNDDLEEEGHTAAFAKMLLGVHNNTGYLHPEHQFFTSPIKRR
jgi:hypothetical protein